MKRYELKFIEGGQGVFKVSVVKDPAIESTLVHFSKEKEEVICFTDQEKRVIYSVVMRPNMDIFRKNVNGEPANVFYTPETVAQAQINYFRNNGNSATNINHSELADAEGIFPFESWTVLDAEKDRAVSFGLDVQEGDWVMGMKVDNDELWNEHLKTGKLDGFSVEATNINYEFKENVQMKTDKNKKTFVEKVKALLFEGEIAEVSKWWNTVINDTFEIGETVMRKGYEEGDEPFAINSGEFELEDGSRILTDSEGVIRFKFPAAPEPASEGETEEEKMAREKMEAEENETEEEKKIREAKEAADEAAAAAEGEEGEEGDELSAEEIKALQSENADLKTQVADLKAEKVKSEEDLEKMTKDKKVADAALLKMAKETPASGGIVDLPNPNGEGKKYEDMNNREKTKFSRENKQY